MEPDDVLERFWDATLDSDEIDYEAFLAEGGEEVREAVATHRLLQRAARRWNQQQQPRQLGRFEVLGDLGAGGLGRVYLGWDPELRRQVAIKVIARDRWAMNEARAIAHLDHRSVVQVFEVGHDRLVMELLDGGSLQTRIETMVAGESTALDGLRARLHCLVRIAEGLAYCHERGILHRDVKPGNVLFAREDEHPRLVDFGLAHLDELESLDITQNLVGSPAYLAPEQVESGETGTDSRSDVFSFGVLAYELLTLVCPFRRETRTATLAAVSRARAKPLRSVAPEIPRPVELIVRHCLELDPTDRYQTMGEVVADLQNALANRPISIGERSLAHRLKLLYQRNRRVTWVAGAGMSAALVFAASLWARSARAERIELLEKIDGLELSLGEISNSREFIGVGLNLSEASLRASVLDGTAVGRTLFGRTRPRAHGVAELWSQRLGEIIRSSEDPEQRLYPPDTWKPALQLDERLLPDAPWNADLRNRGRVSLAPTLAAREDLVFLKQGLRGEGFDAGFTAFRPTPFEEFPSPGYYRVLVPGIWERDFLITSTWQEGIVLDIPERRLNTYGWMELQERGLLASPLITNAQYVEFCEQASGMEPPTIELEGSDPYHGTWEQLQAFADWFGGRLPCAEEAAEILTRYGAQRSPRLAGEYVSDVFDLTNLADALVVKYDLVTTGPDMPPRAWIAGVSASRELPFSSESERYGFRIVYLDSNR